MHNDFTVSNNGSLIKWCCVAYVSKLNLGTSTLLPRFQRPLARQDDEGGRLNFLISKEITGNAHPSDSKCLLSLHP